MMSSFLRTMLLAFFRLILSPASSVIIFLMTFDQTTFFLEIRLSSLPKEEVIH